MSSIPGRDKTQNAINNVEDTGVRSSTASLVFLTYICSADKSNSACSFITYFSMSLGHHVSKFCEEENVFSCTKFFCTVYLETVLNFSTVKCKIADKKGRIGGTAVRARCTVSIF
jgi:hypothetical protein